MLEPPELGPILRERRQGRGLTLDALAATSGVSRSMLSQIERGQANPTFATLWHLTQALDLSLEELVGSEPGAEPLIEVVTRAETPRLDSDDGGARLWLLAPPNLVGGVEWYELTLAAGAALRSTPHAAGTAEHLTALAGRVKVRAGEHEEELGAGSTARYCADLDHEIKNIGRGSARLLLVVMGTETR